MSDPIKYPITITVPPNPPIQTPTEAYVQENIIHAAYPDGSTELLEMFTSKEIYYVFPDVQAGKFFGTYSSSYNDGGRTYFIDKRNINVGYTNIVL